MRVSAGSVVCLLGPSGCGKTTVLRAIAGFHPLALGEILINGTTVSQPGFTLPPEKRHLGMVFQDHALFPHLDDAVGVMHEGKLLQWDTPYNLYHEPNNRFVADFIGQGVFLRGTLLTPDTVETEIGVHKGNRAYDWGRGAQIELLLRPDDIVPDPDGPLKAKEVKKALRGAEILYTLRLPRGGRLLALFPSHADHAIGERVGIRVQADHLVAFPLAAGHQAKMAPAVSE